MKQRTRHHITSNVTAEHHIVQHHCGTIHCTLLSVLGALPIPSRIPRPVLGADKAPEERGNWHKKPCDQSSTNHEANSIAKNMFCIVSAHVPAKEAHGERALQLRDQHNQQLQSESCMGQQFWPISAFNKVNATGGHKQSTLVGSSTKASGTN